MGADLARSVLVCASAQCRSASADACAVMPKRLDRQRWQEDSTPLRARVSRALSVLLEVRRAGGSPNGTPTTCCRSTRSTPPGTLWTRWCGEIVIEIIGPLVEFRFSSAWDLGHLYLRGLRYAVLPVWTAHRTDQSALATCRAARFRVVLRRRRRGSQVVLSPERPRVQLMEAGPFVVCRRQSTSAGTEVAHLRSAAATYASDICQRHIPPWPSQRPPLKHPGTRNTVHARCARQRAAEARSTPTASPALVRRSVRTRSSLLPQWRHAARPAAPFRHPWTGTTSGPCRRRASGPRPPCPA